jgi:hypothetical protein
MTEYMIKGPGDFSPPDDDCFPVVFKMTIGDQEAEVAIVAKSNGYELDDIEEVIYEGVNILPALDSCQHISIRNHYERHAEVINRTSQDPEV